MSVQRVPPSDKVRLRWPTRFTAGKHAVVVDVRVVGAVPRGRLARTPTYREQVAARQRYGKRVPLRAR